MEALPTEDPRIFFQDWKAVSGKDLTIIKKKQYFACIVGGDCFGIEVLREWGTDATAQCANAFNRMQEVVAYQEQHGQWPPQNAHPKTKKTSP